MIFFLWRFFCVMASAIAIKNLKIASAILIAIAMAKSEKWQPTTEQISFLKCLTPNLKIENLKVFPGPQMRHFCFFHFPFLECFMFFFRFFFSSFFRVFFLLFFCGFLFFCVFLSFFLLFSLIFLFLDHFHFLVIFIFFGHFSFFWSFSFCSFSFFGHFHFLIIFIF